MPLVGLIGGVSPEATQIYYRHLNRAARERLGGQHSANVLYYMLDYGVMIGHYHDENWTAFIAEVVAGANALKAGGAEVLAITSGTTHVAADAVAAATGLPVIHMLDSLTAAMDRAGSSRPLLLGTPWVMAGEFFRPALLERFGGEPIVPSEQDRALVGRVIFDELVNGEVLEGSRDELISMISGYDADGVILGCTELCMILGSEHIDLPVFDTTAIHAGDIAGMME